MVLCGFVSYLNSSTKLELFPVAVIQQNWPTVAFKQVRGHNVAAGLVESDRKGWSPQQWSTPAAGNLGPTVHHHPAGAAE